MNRFEDEEKKREGLRSSVSSLDLSFDKFKGACATKSGDANLDVGCLGGSVATLLRSRASLAPDLVAGPVLEASNTWEIAPSQTGSGIYPAPNSGRIAPRSTLEAVWKLPKVARGAAS